MAKISGIQGSWQVDLVVNESSTNIESNTSSATWSLIIRRTDSGSYPMYGTPTINISISGKTVYSDSKYFAISSIDKNGVTLLSGAVTDIEHNDNGTIKNNTASFTWSGSGFSPNSVSASGTYSTATIPRASSIAVPNYNLGQNISITIGKKVNSFTSTLTYKIGSKTGTIVTKTSGPTYVWEMSEELISQIKKDNPSNKNISAIIYCETYSGDTKIGNTQFANFTLIITDKPIISDVVTEETIELIKQYTNSIVKYLSVPQFNVTATPSEGSPIATYRVKVGDREITNSSDSLTVNNIQYSYLVDNVRKTKFIVTVTDARGNTSEEYQIEMDFIDYVQLAFNNTDVTLTRLNGTSDFIKLHLTGYVYNGLIGETQNKLTLQYQYKIKNDSTTEWSELKVIEAILNEDNTFIVDNLQLEDEFDYRKNYDIEFYAQDLFLTEKYSTVIKTSETIVKIHKNGLDVKKLTIRGNELYPIGSIYLSVDETNPGELFGGTWERIKGRFLLGAGDNGDGWDYTPNTTGGESVHTLTIDEMPSHTHNVEAKMSSDSGGNITLSGSGYYADWEMGNGSVTPIKSVGGNSAHNNLPPYLAVYMWKRIS